MSEEKLKIPKKALRMKMGALYAVSLLCLGGLVFSGYKIYQWWVDSLNTQEITEQITDSATIVEIDDGDGVNLAESSDPLNSLYWQFLNTKLIDVDFSALKKINPQTVGWLQVSGTNINYPFVQTSDNDYYLYRSFDRSYNEAGWVFADYRNSVNGTDKNMILYAHGRLDSTMFGSLRRIITSGWLNNSENFTIRTSTENENALWQVFSAYKIPTTTDYLQTDFRSDAEFQSFGEMLMGRSVHDFGASFSASDKILTLSTCYNDDERVVLHAKLIKWQTK